MDIRRTILMLINPYRLKTSRSTCEQFICICAKKIIKLICYLWKITWQFGAKFWPFASFLWNRWGFKNLFERVLGSQKSKSFVHRVYQLNVTYDRASPTVINMTKNAGPYQINSCSELYCKPISFELAKMAWGPCSN